jgi:hypothetical protein
MAKLPPKFTTKPSLRQEGTSIVFNCELEGAPKPEITWFRGSDLLKLDNRFVATITDIKPNTYDVKLEVKQASAEDSGTYKAEAKNQHGKTAANINLNLAGKTQRLLICAHVAHKETHGLINLQARVLGDS